MLCPTQFETKVRYSTYRDGVYSCLFLLLIWLAAIQVCISFSHSEIQFTVVLS
jgi:hypothetical protein